MALLKSKAAKAAAATDAARILSSAPAADTLETSTRALQQIGLLLNYLQSTLSTAHSWPLRLVV
jgi:hypothetical protein